MVEIKDLKKGLRVVLPNGMKGPIVRWEIVPSRFFILYDRKVVSPKVAHVLINNLPDSIDADLVTWGDENTHIDVDLDYYNNISK